VFEIEVKDGPNRFSWTEIESKHEQGKSITGKIAGNRLSLDSESHDVMEKTWDKLGWNFKKISSSSSSSRVTFDCHSQQVLSH
jgi:hypothetical protein